MEPCVSETEEAATFSPRRAPLAGWKVWLWKYWTNALVIGLAILLWLPRLSGPIDLRWDAGVYYLLGSSLATGHGYRILSEPGSPEAVQYPPLLPGIVALYARAFGSTDPAVIGPWLRLSYAALFLVYGIGVLTLARKYLSPLLAFIATALCLLNIWTIFLSDLLFAEIPFALVSVTFACVAGSAWKKGGEVTCFLLALTGFLLRTAGVVLLLAWIADALGRKRWRLALLRLALTLLPIALWQGHVERVHRSAAYRHPAYEYQRALYQHYNVTYSDNFRLVDPFKPERGAATTSALANRALTNLSLLPMRLGEAISIPRQFWPSPHLNGFSAIATAGFRMLAGGLGLFVLAGVVWFLASRAWIVASIIIASVALICMTPWPEEFNRYLTPVAPFLAIAAVVGMRQLSVFLCDHTNPPIAKVAKLSLVSVLVMTLLVQIGTATRFLRGSTLAKSIAQSNSLAAGAHFFHKQDWVDWENAATWIGEHAGNSDVVATTAPHQFYLQTGLRAVYPPFEPDPGKASRLIEGVPLKYVLIDQFAYRDFSRRYALPAVENDPARWRLVYAIRRTKVYEHTTGEASDRSG